MGGSPDEFRTPFCPRQDMGSCIDVCCYASGLSILIGCADDDNVCRAPLTPFLGFQCKAKEGGHCTAPYAVDCTGVECPTTPTTTTTTPGCARSCITDPPACMPFEAGACCQCDSECQVGNGGCCDDAALATNAQGRRCFDLTSSSTGAPSTTTTTTSMSG